MVQKKVAEKSNRPKNALVMLSGGIDSTAALWHVLNSPNEYKNVHVHHINIQNIEARWMAESAAVKSILEYMRNYARLPFTNSESTINTPYLGVQFLFDTEVISFMTGYMTSRDPHIKRVIIGGTATDFAIGASEAVKRGKAIHNAFHPNDKDNSGKLKHYPHSHLTKEQVYKTLPQDLALLTWSCRTPGYINGKAVECGKCKTCLLELSTIVRPLSTTQKGVK